MRRFRLSPLLCAAFVAGIIFVQHQPQLPPLLPLGLSGILLLALSWRFPRYRGWLLPLIFALAGAAYADWRAHWRLTEALPPALVWQDMTVEGVVHGFPDINQRRIRFDFVIEQIDDVDSVRLPLTVRLNDYHRGKTPLTIIAAGNRLRLNVRLRPPESAANPHGFDYAGYLFTRNIRLVGYVRQRENARLLAESTYAPRRHLYNAIADSGGTHSALIAALVIGDRSRLSDAQWQVLRRTGTAHLVSVSGMHIGLIFFLAAICFGSLWRCSARLTRILPAPLAAILLALPAALAYALLAGFAVPVQRSFLMAVVAALTLFLGGVGSVFSALMLALLAVSIIDPWAVLTPGLWLSFALTAAVLAAVTGGYNEGSLWWRLCKAQLLLSIVAVPLTLWFFNEASLISPLANLVAVPVVGFAVLPLALAGGIAGQWCWAIADWLLGGLWAYLQWLSALPYASWVSAQPPQWLFFLAVSGGVWLLLPRGVPWRIAGVLPIIAVLLWVPPPPPPGTVEMTVLDVGQGTAVVLQTTEHTLVYDTGRAFGGRIIADYLQGEGVKEIDTLIISHNDYDHRGGMSALLSKINAANIIAPNSGQPCRRGRQWQYDGVTLRMLHPPAAHIFAKGDNDSSCVLHIQSAGGKSALLTGDISAEAEKHITAAADVLLVSHHGSRYSSALAFLQRVGAEIAVIPVGRNEYGHPHPNTLNRLRRAGAEIYRTDTDGALQLQLSDTVQITRWREVDRRYWQRQ